MVPFKKLGAVSYSPSIVAMALSRIISEIKQDIGRKSQFFKLSPAFGAPVRQVAVEILPYRLVGKTRMVWLPAGEKSLRRCLAVSTEYRRVTDGQTDILRRYNPGSG